MSYVFTEFSAAESPFEKIYVDLTHKCNMACSNCYLPNRDIADMDIEKFFQLIRQLPRPTGLRLIGAEPTLRADLPDIIREIKKTNHRPVLVTNGLKLADKTYLNLLYKAGLRIVQLSMNGGDDDSIYLKTDKMRCAKLKIQALRNCDELKMRIAIGVILIKNLNLHTPKNIFQLTKGFKSKIRINLRNVGQIGRRMVDEEENISFSEMISLVSNDFNISVEKIMSYRTTPQQVRFPLNEDVRLNSVWIGVTDWNPYGSLNPDPQNYKRGRVTQNFTLAPAFEHIKANEFGY